MPLDYLEAAPTSSEPWIWTPGSLQDRAKRLHSDILIFQEDMSNAKTAKKLPDSQLLAWRSFRDGWTDWYEHTSASTWLWSATASTLQDYESKLAAWREWYRLNIGQPSGVGPSNISGPAIQIENKGQQELTFDWTPVWWGGGALILLGGAYWWYLRDK